MRAIFDTERLARSPLWSPHQQMGQLAGRQRVVVGGDGVHVTLDDGRRLFDASAALWYANIGHGCAEVAAAAAAQMLRLETWHVYHGFVNDRALELTERLAASVTPIADPKIVLGSGGSDAIEVAVKLARRVAFLRAEPERTIVISRQHGYHGLHAFGSAIVGDDELRLGMGPGPIVADTVLVPHDSLHAARCAVQNHGPKRIAAIVAEPIIGSGGVYGPPPGYLQGLRDLCDEIGALLIFDEVITGFGRAGRWFASDRYGVEPDMTTFAKGITAGYAALGGVFVSPRVWGPFWDPDRPDWVHHFGLTYSGHATACAVAMTVLDIIERDRLVERAAHLETVLADGLRGLQTSERVDDVRVTGLLGAVQMREARSREVVTSMLERGFLLRALDANSVAVSPAFVATDEQVRDLTISLTEVVGQ